jgi:hypothetical protein
MGDLGGRYAPYTARFIDSVLTSPGHTPGELRRAVLARAARLGGLALQSSPPVPLSRRETGNDGITGVTTSAETASGREDLPATLAAYVDKVARHAYKVTDEDLAGLQRAGNSDDALFEVTVAAAAGAALVRLERGLAALRGEEVSSGLVPLSAGPSSAPVPLSATRSGGTQE